MSRVRAAEMKSGMTNSSRSGGKAVCVETSAGVDVVAVAVEALKTTYLDYYIAVSFFMSRV